MHFTSHKGPPLRVITAFGLLRSSWCQILSLGQSRKGSSMFGVYPDYTQHIHTHTTLKGIHKCRAPTEFMKAVRKAKLSNVCLLLLSPKLSSLWSGALQKRRNGPCVVEAAPDSKTINPAWTSTHFNASC